MTTKTTKKSLTASILAIDANYQIPSKARLADLQEIFDKLYAETTEKESKAVVETEEKTEERDFSDSVCDGYDFGDMPLDSIDPECLTCNYQEECKKLSVENLETEKTEEKARTTKTDKSLLNFMTGL